MSGDDQAEPSAVDRFDDLVDELFDRSLRGRPAVDRAMYSISELADFSLIWHLIGASRALAKEDLLANSIRLSAVLGLESAIVNGAVKSIFKRKRPVPEFERPHHLRVPVTSSFPSGHASAAFCAATLLGAGAPTVERFAWFAMAGLVASSRVHVKIHHASDVLGGVAVGLVIGKVATSLWHT